MKHKWFVIFIYVMGAVLLQAQEAMVTDRPDFTESGQLVPSRYLQIEQGTFYANEDGESKWGVGQWLWRYGVSDDFEVRFLPPTFLENAKGKAFLETSIGFKVPVVKQSQHPWVPVSCVVVEKLLLPAPLDFREVEDRYLAKLCMDWDILPTLSLGSNVNYVTTRIADAWESEVQWSLVTGLDLAQDWSVLLEEYTIFEPLEAKTRFKTALIYNVNADLQLDIQYDVSAKNFGDYLIEFGTSMRVLL